MWIKICGIKDTFSALHVLAEGGSAIGLIFVPNTKRYINIETARKILSHMGKNSLLKIGVFQNQSKEEVKKVLEEVPINGLQFHGEESPDYLKEFSSLFLIKAFSIKDDTNLDQLKREIEKYSFCHILLDRTKTEPKISWEKFLNIAYAISKDYKVIIAGGINEENIVEVLEIHPWGIDLSSGVENENFEKDLNKISNLLRKVKYYESTR